MDDATYDISHLLAFDPEPLGAHPSTTRKAQSRQSAVEKRRKPTVAEAQDALSRELMRTAEIHDALIKQYLHTAQNPFQDF